MVRPLPDDVDLVGEQTYSLCLPNAEAAVRARFLPRSEADTDFLMLSTDGLAKSFRDDADFLRLAASWHETIGATGWPR
jgi:hypothetical protein